MVLRTIGIETVDTLADLCCTNSIWTIDLAYLLQKFSVKFSYYTVTLGANPNYSDETFYKYQLPTDVVRVNKLFREVIKAGISIWCRSISEEQISLLILSGKYVAIALVDQHKLSRSWVEDVCASGLGDSGPGYTGHYIVICEYDTDEDEFKIRDHASSRKQDKVTSRCLSEARKSFGTDEDILLISLE
ncbi:guanylyl cyclase 1 [Eucalyptus grandis]|uniref:guanylyl cyclase 1 n=1 Tax=Eucalyptus grandis TaxID=71139 RepID=UPI00192F1125|nr:guanylyl cyclase 1 [Eucalyptus grandis]